MRIFLTILVFSFCSSIFARPFTGEDMSIYNRDINPSFTTDKELINLAFTSCSRIPENLLVQRELVFIISFLQELAFEEGFSILPSKEMPRDELEKLCKALVNEAAN